MAFPAIGDRYGERRRIVFVGMNPGRDQVDDEETFSGYFAPGNPGKWHQSNFRTSLLRMSSIALGESSQSPDDVFPFVAWINLVKCTSTTEPNGNPSWRMWVSCAPHAWRELEILQPEIIIALGSQVHADLVCGASHRGGGVTIPADPYDEYWAEIPVSGSPVGLFNAYHPNGMRAVHTAWNDIKRGRKPNNKRVSQFLEAATGSTAAAKWRTCIRKVSSGSANPLVEYLERRFLAPDAVPPPRLASSAARK